MSTPTSDKINSKNYEAQACDNWVGSLYGIVAARSGQYARFFKENDPDEEIVPWIGPDDDALKTSAAWEFNSPSIEAFDGQQRNIKYIPPSTYKEEETTTPRTCLKTPNILILATECEINLKARLPGRSRPKPVQVTSSFNDTPRYEDEHSFQISSFMNHRGVLDICP